MLQQIDNEVLHSKYQCTFYQLSLQVMNNVYPGAGYYYYYYFYYYYHYYYYYYYYYYCYYYYYYMITSQLKTGTEIPYLAKALGCLAN